MTYEKAVILNTVHAGQSAVPRSLKDKLYEAFEAADNQDVALEEWPDLVEKILIKHAFEGQELDPPGEIVNTNLEEKHLVVKAAECIKGFQSFVNIMSDGPDESDQNMAVRMLLEARALAKTLLPVLSTVRAKEVFDQQLANAGESYPDTWLHGVVHLNPNTGEIHSDGDYALRDWLQNNLVGDCVGAVIHRNEGGFSHQLENLQGLYFGIHKVYVRRQTNKLRDSVPGDPVEKLNFTDQPVTEKGAE